MKKVKIIFSLIIIMMIFTLNAYGLTYDASNHHELENVIFEQMRKYNPDFDIKYTGSLGNIDDVLKVKYQNKNIKEVLDMSFSKALNFFKDNKNIYEKVSLVCDLGLGYMQLGQQLSTVSGGEAQRLKLAREMSKYKNKKNLLYLFDEPTVGLHSKDVLRIIDIMKRITSQNNTVVVVEHNPDMMLTADYIIDMGPGAGRHGGTVVFSGTPKELIDNAQTKTADYLRNYVNVG